jgi:hypothetical protein
VDDFKLGGIFAARLIYALKKSFSLEVTLAGTLHGDFTSNITL